MKSSRKRYKMNVNVKVFLWGETFKNIHTLVLCRQCRVFSFLFVFPWNYHITCPQNLGAVHCFSKEMTSFTSVVGRVDMWGKMQMIDKKNSSFLFGVT